jgi:hypothetical protein
MSYTDRVRSQVFAIKQSSLPTTIFILPIADIKVLPRSALQSRGSARIANATKQRHVAHADMQAFMSNWDSAAM